MQFLGGIIDRVCAVIGAFLFAQFPQFFSQYQHQLSGHIAELTYQVNLLHQSAKLTHKTVPELIAKFLQNSDLDIAHQGVLMKNMMTRLDAFSEAHNMLQQASFFTKPFFFARYFNYAIFQDTWQQFQVGLSLTSEGIAYALVGMAAGYLLFHGFCHLCKALKTRLIPNARNKGIF